MFCFQNIPKYSGNIPPPSILDHCRTGLTSRVNQLLREFQIFNFYGQITIFTINHILLVIRKKSFMNIKLNHQFDWRNWKKKLSIHKQKCTLEENVKDTLCLVDMVRVTSHFSYCFSGLWTCIVPIVLGLRVLCRTTHYWDSKWCCHGRNDIEPFLSLIMILLLLFVLVLF